MGSTQKEKNLINAYVQTEADVQCHDQATTNIPIINSPAEITAQSGAMIAVLLWKVLNIKENKNPTEQMNENIKMIKLTLNVQFNVNDLSNFLQTGDPLISPLVSNTVESIIADRNDTSCSNIVQHAQPLLTSTVISIEPITVKISHCKSNSAAGVPWLHKKPTKKRK